MASIATTILNEGHKMIHFTCDCCQCDLDPNEEIRYVVKMEIYAAMEPVNADEIDEDSDHLLEIHEILERQLDIDNDQVGADVYRKCRFDLCANCHRKFVKNPVGRDSMSHFGFSQN